MTENAEAIGDWAERDKELLQRADRLSVARERVVKALEGILHRHGASEMFDARAALAELKEAQK